MTWRDHSVLDKLSFAFFLDFTVVDYNSSVGIDSEHSYCFILIIISSFMETVAMNDEVFFVQST